MGVVMALDVPAEINEVFIVEPYRYRVVRQLTREGFLRQMAENRRHEDHESRTFNFEGTRKAIMRRSIATARCCRFGSGTSPQSRRLVDWTFRVVRNLVA
jgi:hypothetical protein